MTDWNETVGIKRHHLDELRFFGFAGICISRFQQVDDYLKTPFASLLAIPEKQASVVFAAIRTVKRRCDVIQELMQSAESSIASRWPELVKRILRAESNRNSIAHGSPVFGGGVVTVKVDRELNKTEVESQIDSFFYLEKRGYADWTTERLLHEARQTEMLLSDLYAFGRELTPA